MERLVCTEKHVLTGRFQPALMFCISLVDLHLSNAHLQFAAISAS